VYGGDLAPASEKSWDVQARDGRLIQVKCRVVGEGKRTQTFSPFRSWGFDACVFVVLNSATYDVMSAREVQVHEIRAVASRSEWVGGHRVTVAAVAKMPGEDVTGQFRRALQRL
jgi:hypothetical protein